MAKKENLGTTIYYQEKMEQALADQIEWEGQYMQRLMREKKKNKEGFRRYIILCVMLGWILSGTYAIMYVIEKQDYYEKINNDYTGELLQITGGVELDKMFYIFAAIIFAFALMGFVFCMSRLIHYAKRRKKEQDNRDGLWRTYEDMTERSRERFEKLKNQHLMIVGELTNNRQLQASLVKQQVSGDIIGKEETISIDELKQAMLEEIPQEQSVVEGDPLKKTW